MDLSSLMFFLPLFIFAFILSKVFKKSKSKSSVKLPPGPRKMPLIGHLHLMARSLPPYHTLRDLAVKYGPLMHLQLGEVSTTVVSSPEIAKELFKTHDINFANRPSLTVVEILGSDKGIAFSPYGEYWRQLRKIFSLELLSAKRVQSFRPLREEESIDLCRWIASKEGSVINLTQRVDKTMYDVITRACLGKKTGEAAKFLSIVKQGVQMASGFHIEDLYPSLKFSRLTSRLRRVGERLHPELDKILAKIIIDHQEDDARKIFNGATCYDQSMKQEDIVDVLLKLLQVDDDCEPALAIDKFKYVLMEIFGASETISTTVEWSMSELLKHPEVMKKAQDEVRQVYGNQGYVDESHLHELKYLKLVIKETLRLHPPLPLLLPRENKEACKINGYDIPVKTRLLVNVWAMGRDPRHWGDNADCFVPERFLDDNCHVDFKMNNFEYLPFGAGRRICPGMSFGLANAELVLAMFLYHFDWMLPYGMKPEQLDMAETLGVVIRKKNLLHVIPIVKKPLCP